ncbi:MAG: hypothetical protein LHV69_09600 [Elusimicrobia bacterium]|nr:hypothetical protein [Candidatus Obscuribacterium magneticum]
MIPLLEARAPGFKERISRLSILVQDEEKFWDAFVDKIESKLAAKQGRGRLLDFKKLLSYPPAVQRRFLRRMVGDDVLTFKGVEGVRQWMSSPPTGGRVWQLRKGWMAERLSKSKGSPSAALFWIGKSMGKKRIQ